MLYFQRQQSLAVANVQQQPLAVQLEADFYVALNHIGFTPDEQGAIIEYTCGRNVAMLELLSEEDLIRMCKASACGQISLFL
jgi:hypothetical protein